MSFTGYALIYQVGLTVDPTQACNALKCPEITKFQVWSFSLLITDKILSRPQAKSPDKFFWTPNFGI